MLSNGFIAVGALLSGMAVLAGAFGSHALKQKLPPNLLIVFETAARYQMYTALGIILFGLWLKSHGGSPLAGYLLIVGACVFSGSLYALVFSGQKWLGAVTPFGGLLIMAGWFLFAWAALRS